MPLIHPEHLDQLAVREMPEPKILISDLNVYYGNFHALKNVSLPIPKGCVTAFIGPSGCGKSTLLRSLNRMQDLYPEQRAEGSIRMGDLEILDPSIDVTAHKAALWDDVKDKLTQPGTSLSGGQQQRLCIARGIAVKPEVLLLDEPCSALDPIATARIEELIDELKKDYTVVIVSHSVQQAARISEYTAFMYLGELIEFGDTKTIFTHPQKKATEDFITGRFG